MVTRWMIEWYPTLDMRRVEKGLAEPGDEVIIEGYWSKDGSNTANGSSVRLPDGRKLLAGSSKDGNAVK